MKTFTLLSALAALGAVTASPTKTTNQPPSKRASLPVVTASGNTFYTSDGERFYIRGIDYQPGGNTANTDPLADTDICMRDLKFLKELGVNTVRVYILDNSANHDECMKAYAEAGIYVVADVNNQNWSLNRNDPFPSYNAKYLQSVFATVEMFAKYDNTLAFFSGNEVINEANNTAAAPYIKAVTRDIKNYISSQGLRKIPVGYSAADVSENRVQLADYLNCGSDDARSDFFAFNDYSWCNTDFKTSGWDQKVKTFTDYGIPIFLSEYGCTQNGARKFNELSALMSNEMDKVYSGGVMFEYTNEENKMGIVTLKGGVKGTIETMPEFDNFKAALAKYPAPSGTAAKDAATTTHAVDCPSMEAKIWEVEPSGVPAIPKEAEKYFNDGAGTGPGLKGGSQTAADSGTSSSNVTSGVPTPEGSGSGSSGNGSSTDDSGVAGSLHAPLAVTGLSVFFALCGALLL